MKKTITFALLLASLATMPSAGALAASAAAPVLQGPVPGTRLTDAYARMVARDLYFWAWPMVNLYNRRLVMTQVPSPGLMDGIVPLAPLNRLAMLSDYIAPEERYVACPNQDVVYGAGLLGLDVSPVVVQVPDFGKRFWVYQVVDVRTDSFAELGSMYASKPGFYLLVGPTWKGATPKGIVKVFRSPTNTGMVIPRVFVDDTPQDKDAVQSAIAGVDMYPLADFDGKAKRHDWSKLPTIPKPASSDGASSGAGETHWVFPEKFFEQLGPILDDAPPLAGEEARYARARWLLAAAQASPALTKAMVDEAAQAQQDVVDPLLQFRNWGLPLAANWTTQIDGARFGQDYFTRTAVARSNILVNVPTETKYFYQDLSASGARLNGAHKYTVTFAKGQLPPVRGFWSLTLYDRYHFFAPNEIKRYSVGTKNKDLRTNADGSLTIYVQADAPTDPAQRANWLPAPAGEDFSLFVRAYWPDKAITDGVWTPPPVEKR
jgi:hypothetical protein